MNILDIIFPRRCPGCDEVLFWKDYRVGFCEKCRKEIKKPGDRVCLKCGKTVRDKERQLCNSCEKHKHFFTQGKGVYLYTGVMKTAMYRFKYSNRRIYAKIFAKDAVDSYALWINSVDPDIIIPIPMYRKKERKRGYNQATEFAKELSKQVNIPIESNTLVRIKDTTPLKSLNPSERKKNLKNAFIFRKNVVQYENALLIDDIYTTGATMDAAAYVLKKSGVKRVYGLYACVGKGDT